MLVLDHVDVHAEGSASAEVDEYVPVTVEITHRDSAPTVYWRAKPSPRTLVEVGLSSETGLLRSVTVTAIDVTSVVEASSSPKPSQEDETEGVPCFDIKGWRMSDDFATRFNDEEVAVRLVLANRSCSVEFCQPAAPATFVKFGNIRCGFDDQKVLVRIDIESLDHEQVDTLHRLITGNLFGGP